MKNYTRNELFTRLEYSRMTGATKTVASFIIGFIEANAGSGTVLADIDVFAQDANDFDAASELLRAFAIANDLETQWADSDTLYKVSFLLGDIEDGDIVTLSLHSTTVDAPAPAPETIYAYAGTDEVEFTYQYEGEHPIPTESTLYDFLVTARVTEQYDEDGKFYDVQFLKILHGVELLPGVKPTNEIPALAMTSAEWLRSKIYAELKEAAIEAYTAPAKPYTYIVTQQADGVLVAEAA